MSRDHRPTGESLPDPHESEQSDATRALVDKLLDQDRMTLDEAPAPLVDAMWDKVAHDTVEHTPGLRDRLRELGTPVRMAVGLFAMIGVGAMFLGLMGMRQDLDLAGMAWLGGLHVVVLIGAVAGLALALRPTHRPPLNVLAWVSVATVLLLPFAIALVPGLLPGMTGPAPAMAHLMCGGGGVLMAVPATVLVLMMDRSPEASSWRVLLAAGAAGLSAFGIGAWHCPSADPLHLVVAHAGLGTLLGLVALGTVRLVSAIRR